MAEQLLAHLEQVQVTAAAAAAAKQPSAPFHVVEQGLLGNIRIARCVPCSVRGSPSRIGRARLCITTMSAISRRRRISEGAGC